ncbi:hypothetical protein RRG08_016146 [Elysia crispata]|uniref:Uncharacterized protein n=1 Tax=Elysia crispata TaxID=231223 RepID=A0AAE1D8T0_9GAST|nr:hypothetical protein RRG08_016146 [Elysia crispata]
MPGLTPPPTRQVLMDSRRSKGVNTACPDNTATYTARALAFMISCESSDFVHYLQCLVPAYLLGPLDVE